MNDKPSTIVGIDLGTTFSVVAYLDASGIPRTVTNAEGDLTTPSVVLFDENEFVVGKEAAKAAALFPDKVAEFAKREMGKPLFSKTFQGQSFPPEVIQSLILEKLKRDASEKLGPIKQAVITVPAYFNEPKRRATQDAGRLAGLDVLAVINEPTAAAIAFGVSEGFLNSQGESQRTETILVYDLGGGTFDVSVMRIDGKHYEVLATDGNVMLGGIDWDMCLAKHLVDRFADEHLIDPCQDPKAMSRFMREAEEAKRTLSARSQANVLIEFAGSVMLTTVTRGEFDDLTAHLLERTRFTINKVLKDAGIGWSDITRVLLVGGSTRMPQVGQMLQQQSGRVADRSLSADEAVAHGAALYGKILHAQQTDEPQTVRVTNVNSHSLGVLGIEKTTGRHRNRVMIPRNSPLPSTHTAQFETHTAGQPNVAVQVIEGGDSSGQNSTPIGKCVVHDLPPGLPAGTPVLVKFQYNADGMLGVAANLPTVGLTAQLRIQRKSGLSDSALIDWNDKMKEIYSALDLD
ncbi:Chaperone protein DnaK [Rosistilla carotiformis]|uniref:Chaperone protein DnaK n=1 Tax=Rosistilla carotiformis TaxID=2528017 RepID=A0A518JZ31_9BACT|nr:Hsp70 family protein [Rosistilla carotiformis]QDV70797.1 Chaperone protein DnaK [Rosistilla carotiformis]